jgi:anti-sigma factor RsiW
MSGTPMKDEARRLKRLLGPAGPEISCEECFDELDRYVELELSGADADAAIPGMAAHLEGCPACHEDHRSLRALVEAEGDAA